MPPVGDDNVVENDLEFGVAAIETLGNAVTEPNRKEHFVRDAVERDALELPLEMLSRLDAARVVLIARGDLPIVRDDGESALLERRERDVVVKQLLVKLEAEAATTREDIVLICSDSLEPSPRNGPAFARARCEFALDRRGGLILNSGAQIGAVPCDELSDP